MAPVERIPASHSRRGTYQKVGRKRRQDQTTEAVRLAKQTRFGRYLAIGLLGSISWILTLDSAVAQRETGRVQAVQQQPGSSSNGYIRPAPQWRLTTFQQRSSAGQSNINQQSVSPSDRPLSGRAPSAGRPPVNRAPGLQLESEGQTATLEADGPNAAGQRIANGQNTSQDGDSSEAGIAASDRLELADVIASVYRSYPMIEQARLQRGVASGDLLAAYGSYDLKLQGYSLSEPTGFYRNFRNGVGVARQTWWGGYISAGYRIGRGDFAPWYKERETNKSGEFKLGMAQPLLQGLAIDPQRVAVFQASIDQQLVDPLVQQAILNIAFEAAQVYWEWVTVGGVLQAQRELLNLAEVRQEQIEFSVDAEFVAPVEAIFNRQLIAERQGKVFETEQKYRATAFKLALYLRDEQGQMIVPEESWLPSNFPTIEPLPPGDFQADLAAALSRRPEPRSLRLEMRRVQYDQELARNNLLPRLDVIAEASQDAGDPASSSNDKGRFELLLGLQGEVPIQRRKARGKIQSTSAKIAQVSQKLRLQQDKIAAELQTAYNTLQLAAQRVQQADDGFRLAIETLTRYQFAFRNGYTDLIYLNLLETKANESEIKLIEAQRSWFSALAAMQAALGLDPLEQAIRVAELPESDMPGPGNLPQPAEVDEDELNQQFQLDRKPLTEPEQIPARPADGQAARENDED